MSVFRTLTDNFTEGYSPLAFDRELENIYWICHYHRRNQSVGIFQAGIFFFWRTIFVCKTIGNCFFFPTDLAMELGITDERKADERFSSVKKLPTNSKSQTDGIFPSVKLCNLVVYVFFKSMPGSGMTQTPGPNNHARPKRIWYEQMIIKMLRLLIYFLFYKKKHLNCSWSILNRNSCSKIIYKQQIITKI